MERLRELLSEGIAQGVFPGAAYAVGNADGAWSGCSGRQTYAPVSHSITSQSLWDLASVTKVAATTAAAMLLSQDGILDLDRPVREILPEFYGGVTARHLLLHESGLPPYADVTHLADGEAVWRHICGLPLATRPGTAVAYSCLGFVALHRLIERLAGQRMDELLEERVYSPLGMISPLFNPRRDLRSRCVPTAVLPRWQKALEDTRGFERVQEEFVQGDVHDPIACVMGGVSGNAGLFSTTADLAVFARAILRLQGGPFDNGILSDWTNPQSVDGSHCLGWMAKSPVGSSAGSLFSPRSFGHTGYTGTSIWCDPERGLYSVLLTNRVHPDDREGIAAFRPKFHDAVVEILGR